MSLTLLNIEQVLHDDTIAGICLSNGGADIPHPLGEIIGGICQKSSWRNLSYGLS